jgi:hypothetical protein
MGGGGLNFASDPQLRVCERAERMRNIAEFMGIVEEAERTITVMDYTQFLEVPSETGNYEMKG